MVMTAGSVQVPQGLQSALSGVGNGAYNTIGANYNKLKTQLGSDASARGMNGMAATGPGSYAGNRLPTAQGLDVGNLESSLGAGVGDTAYTEAKKQRDFDQEYALAKKYGQLMKPSGLQQALGAVGQIGTPLAELYGAGAFSGFGGRDPLAGVYGNV